VVRVKLVLDKKVVEVDVNSGASVRSVLEKAGIPCSTSLVIHKGRIIPDNARILSDTVLEVKHTVVRG